MSVLKDLAGNQEWQAIIAAARKMRPDLPKWDPNMPDAPNTWIYKSGQQDGFDLAMQIFAPLK